MKPPRLQNLKPRVASLRTAAVRSFVATPRMRGSGLQNLRARWFADHPLCAKCSAMGRTSLARELDHIVPLCEGGADADHNRQSLCTPCHKVKSADETRRRQTLATQE